MNRCLLGILIILYGLSSCQKNSLADKNESPPVIPDSIRLQKVIFIDSTLAAPSDTLSITSFVYDNTGRVTEANEIYKPVPGGIPGYMRTKYYYSGTGKLPVKRTKITLNSNLPQIYHQYDTTWFNYDVLERKISDSAMIWTYVRGVRDLTPSAVWTQFCRYKTDTIILSKFNKGVLMYTDTSLTNSQGHVNRHIIRYHNYFLPGGERLISYDYIYNDKVNPISRMNISKSFNNSPYLSHNFIIEKMLQAPQGKLAVQQRENYGSGNSGVSATTYCQYNNHDLLTSVTYSYYLSLSGLNWRKYVLVYNN